MIWFVATLPWAVYGHDGDWDEDLDPATFNEQADEGQDAGTHTADLRPYDVSLVEAPCRLYDQDAS